VGRFKFLYWAAEVWGPRAKIDPLFDFFQHLFLEASILDLALVKLNASWRNKRTWEDHIAKRLDRFLVAYFLLSHQFHFQQWIGIGGDSDHSLIFLEISVGSAKPPSPFKYNVSWATKESFQSLVKNSWLQW